MLLLQGCRSTERLPRPLPKCRSFLGADCAQLNFRTGPTSDRVGRALYGGFWTYVQTFSLVMDRFKIPKREGLNALHVRGEIAFKKLSDEQTKDVGRNDPCPCGSGRKFKRCHGA